MGFLHLGKMTLSSVFTKPETRLYPIEKREPFERTKGTVVCDVEKCIFCGACVRNCPTAAIKVSKEQRTWAINPYDCIQCANCVMTCPPKCLDMDGTYPKAAVTKQVYLYHAHPLSIEEKEEIARQERERQEKIAKAKAAAAAKKKAEAEAKAKAEAEAAAAADAAPAPEAKEPSQQSAEGQTNAE